MHFYNHMTNENGKHSVVLAAQEDCEKFISGMFFSTTTIHAPWWKQQSKYSLQICWDILQMTKLCLCANVLNDEILMKQHLNKT